MDHLCHKCNAPIEPGRPFCSHCGAPQIKVSIPEPSILPEGIVPPPLSDRVQWRVVMPIALIAAVLSVLVVNLLAVVSPVLGVLSIGLVGTAVVMAYARKRRINPTTSTGLKIGLVAGFFAFLAHGTLALIQFASNPELLAQEIRKAMEASGAANAQARQLLERMLTPEGLIIFIILSLIVMLILFAGLGSIGGAVGASLSRKPSRPSD